MAKGNITGTPFLPLVTKQIEKRQEFLGENPKQDKHIVYQNNKSAFIRLASSVDIVDEYNVDGAKFYNLREAQDYQNKIRQDKTTLVEKDGKKLPKYAGNPENFNTVLADTVLQERGLPKSLTGTTLAQSAILFGGVNGLGFTKDSKVGDITVLGGQPFPIFPQGVFTGDSSIITNTFGSAYGWGGTEQGLRPMPGIMGADVSYYNRGALQKVNITCKVFTVEQLQVFDLLYFRIGYSMLLEWGHNIYIDNDGNLINRKDYFTKPFNLFFNLPNNQGVTGDSKQNQIINSIKEEREQSAYNYDAMIGKLTNFSWKFNNDGSYDITLNLIGLGDVIESMKINQAVSVPGAPKPPSQVIAERGAKIAEQQRAEENSLTAEDTKLNSTSDGLTKETETLSNQSNRVDGTFSDNSDDCRSSELLSILTTMPQSDEELIKYKLVYNLYTSGERNNWEEDVFITNKSDGKVYKVDALGLNATPYSDLSARCKEVLSSNLTDANAYIANQKKQQDLEKKQAENDKKKELLDRAKEQSERKFRELTRQIEAAKERQEIAPEAAKESAGKTKFNAVLYGWIEGLNKDPNFDDSSLNPKYYTQGVRNFAKINYKAKSLNSGETGVSQHQFSQYYVRFGHMLEWITGNLLYYDKSDSTAQTGTSIPNPGTPEFNTQTPEQQKETQRKKDAAVVARENQLDRQQEKNNESNLNNQNPNQPKPTQNTKKQSFDGLYISKIPIIPNNAIPMFTIDTDIEKNRCLAWPLQISSDPFVCIIPILAKDQQGNGWEAFTSKTNSTNTPDLSAYFDQENMFQGKLMNIFINIDFAAKVLSSNVDSNGKVNLLKYLNELCTNINDALGNVNKLQAIYDPEENTVKIAEDNILKRGNEIDPVVAKFKSYGVTPGVGNGQGSFLRSVDFQVQLPPNMAAMATIAAQAKGNIVGENATALSKLNTGLKDRIITYKLDATTLGAKVKGQPDSPEQIFYENLKKMYAIIRELYIDLIYQKDNVDTLRSINRDVSLHVIGEDAEKENIPAPFFIPFNMSLEMDGLSGMVNYQRFAVEEQILPYSYRPSSSTYNKGTVDFLIKGISHRISNNEWTTKIDSLTVSAKGQRSVNSSTQIKVRTLPFDFSFVGNTAQPTKSPSTED